MPRIYVACLSAYNSGVHHGAWIDATQDPDTIWEAIHNILKTSPEPNVAKRDAKCVECGTVRHITVSELTDLAKYDCTNPLCPGVDLVWDGEAYPSSEEWAVHDFEDFYGADPGQYPNVEKLHELAELLEEHGQLFAKLMQHCDDVDEAKSYIEDGYRGEYDSLAHWASESLDNTGFFSDIPKYQREAIERYFDFESYARDMEMSGEIFTIKLDNKVHVFEQR
jgi:antirestriction protein